MNRSYWKSGAWNAVCAVCGFEFKSDQLRERWDGVKVCTKDWEPRHILDFFTNPPPERQIPWSQPENETVENFVTVTASDSPYTMTSDVREVLVDPSGGNVVINFPDTTDYDFRGTAIRLYRTDESSNTVTFQTQGSDRMNINGNLLTSIATGAIGQIRFINSESLVWRLG